MSAQFKFSTRQFAKRLFILLLSLFIGLAPAVPASAQGDSVTGSFWGQVTDNVTGKPLAGITVQFINQTSQVPVAARTDAQGHYSKALLPPGYYLIRVIAPGYRLYEKTYRLLATKSNDVQPVPIPLIPEAPPVVATNPPTVPQPKPEVANISKIVTPTPTPTPTPVADDSPLEINTTDARRGGAFTDTDVARLPLGAATFTRSFDELALLLPGVALPPQTQGRVAGPGVGPGVGSAGQFAVNGLRSRGNNFTVDGSDNNDEDIGVRRQGFFALVPQPLESIQEYTVITSLAPAQFGRNLGAYVNAISKSGGYQTHGTFYGFFNLSQLNARDYFDTLSDGKPTQLQARVPLNNTQIAFDNFVNNRPNSFTLRDVRIDNQPALVRNPAAGKNSLTFGQAGFVLGGPLLPKPANGSAKSVFYFLSFEGQLLNANQEESFAVPTVEERGLNKLGGAGLSELLDQQGRPTAPRGFPANVQGSAILSLFPFPNNLEGVYGRNTLTQILPASAQGNIASLKFDHNFKFAEREQAITARYNRTDDWRNIPATGGALFATLRPVVRTHNFSLFLNSELSGAQAVTPLFNQFRASYGRTRLLFEEERDPYLIPSGLLPKEAFLLNAPLLLNFTNPDRGQTFVDYRHFRVGEGPLWDTETSGFFTPIGPVGRVALAGFSPLGVDVFNFPQERVNNTYQLADTLTLRRGPHNVTLGGDFRRTDLNSTLPRNARPLITFDNAPQFEEVSFDEQGRLKLKTDSAGIVLFKGFSFPTNLPATAAATNVSQTLARATPSIGLRYYQTNLFAQNEWRVRPNLALSFGLRYEYNTPPREVHELIERTFKDKDLDLLPALRDLVKGRDGIFAPDRNNFAPRFGLAFARNFFGTNSTVFRVGYGLFYDQAIGAVVSQSRNVFPNFLTVNTGGGLGTLIDNSFDIFNTALAYRNEAGQIDGNKICVKHAETGQCLDFRTFIVPGTLNRFNEDVGLKILTEALNTGFPGEFGFTLPDRNLPMPRAHQYSFTIEQQLNSNWVASLAYVGTQGQKLLRLTTPNLGPSVFLPSFGYNIPNPASPVPFLYGLRFTPGEKLKQTGDKFERIEGRPIRNLGTVYLYQTTGESRYDSFQAQLRGRFRNAVQFQVAYTFSKALDDVSDVFDLAGAPALPQHSCTLTDKACNYDSERAVSNFDARHRLAYHFTWSLPRLSNQSRVTQLFFGGFDLVGTGQFQTGQPFTVNSIFDVNLDGNLTDRLQSTNGLRFTGDRRQPLQRLVPIISDTLLAKQSGLIGGLIAQVGNDGAVGRNTLRASNYLLLNLALNKNFALTERQTMTFRVEAFNFIDRANFGIPVRFLEAPGFGQATDTVTPGRRIQFALKYSF